MTENQQKTEAFFITWSAPEFVHYEKGYGWFAALAIIAIALVIVALFMQNFLFALIIIMASFLVYIQAARRPRTINFIISEAGITVDEKNYEFSEFRSFWVFEEPELRTVSLISRKLTRPQMHLPLADQDAQMIRLVLKDFITEKKQEEALIDSLARKIKF